jgi:Ca2+-binding EF-hand superfamily protein
MAEKDLAKLFDNEDMIKASAKAAFDEYDKEKKGFIETNRLEEILTKMAKEVNVAPPTKEDIAKLIEEQDKDKTGKVDLNGFIPFFKLVSKSMAAALK